MELDYKTALAFSSRYDRDAVTEFRSLLYEWLRDKRLDADRLTDGVTQFNESTVGTLASLPQRDGSIIERFRLTEVRPVPEGTQTWQSEILVFQHADGVGEVLVHVSDPRENTPGQRPGPTGVPGFVRLLLDTTAVSDGLMSLRNGPTVVDTFDEQLVHDMIVDETRRLPLVLAPTPEGVSIEQWADDVHAMTRGMAGQAGVFVIAPSLMAALDGHTGLLTLPRGGMRLVPPDTDPASRASVSNSYYVKQHRIAERGTRRVERHWTWLAREYGNTQPWPKHLQRVMRAITTHERDVLLTELDKFVASRGRARSVPDVGVAGDATTQQSTTPVDAEALQQIEGIERVEYTSGLEQIDAVHGGEITQDSVDITGTEQAGVEVTPVSGEVDTEQIVHDALVAALPNEDIINRILTIGGCATITESLQFALLLAGEYDDLEHQVKAAMQRFSGDFSESDVYFEQALDLQARVQQLEAELEDVEGRLDHETRGADYLRRKLVEIGQADVAYSTVTEEVELAQDFEAVLEVVRSLPFINFTGDESVTLDLDDMRGSQPAAKKTHRALLALNDYARAKADGNWNSGAFSEYLADTPAGYTSISGKILASKESDDVARNPKFRKHRELPMPDGQLVFMEAHIKILREGSFSPRLHYYDDTGKSGVIVVGYIGAHLPNQQS